MSIVTSALSTLSTFFLAGATAPVMVLNALPILVGLALVVLLLRALRYTNFRLVMLVVSFVFDLSLMLSLAVSVPIFGMLSPLLLWGLWTQPPAGVGPTLLLVAFCGLALWAFGAFTSFAAVSGVERLRLAFRHGHADRRYASRELVLASLLGGNLLGAVVTAACLRPAADPSRLEPIGAIPACPPDSVRYDAAPTVAVRSQQPDLDATLGLEELGWAAR